jgi:hypothetical protein
MFKEPNDLVFNRSGKTLRFAAWNMSHDKGANAGVQIIINTEAGDGREVSPDDLFGQKTKAVISVQELMHGMSYKDLQDLSKWANNAAKFLKKAETKYRGVSEFNKEHSVNALRVEEPNNG